MLIALCINLLCFPQAGARRALLTGEGSQTYAKEEPSQYLCGPTSGEPRMYFLHGWCRLRSSYVFGKSKVHQVKSDHRVVKDAKGFHDGPLVPDVPTYFRVF